MVKFNIEVKETLSRCFEIEASTVEEAIDFVESMYKRELIVLDESDFAGCEIKIM